MMCVISYAICQFKSISVVFTFPLSKSSLYFNVSINIILYREFINIIYAILSI